MSELQFPNVGNALLAGSSAAYQQGRSRREADAERRRQESQQYIEPALRGDQGAFGKLAANAPETAASIATMLGRMDGAQRAKAKDAAEYTAQAANAILQADPASRPGIYRQMREDGIRRGFNLDSLPPEYNPGLDGMLRSQRSMAIPILEQMKIEENRPTPLGAAPSGGGGAAPNREAFIQTMTPHALEVAKATGLDPRLVIAQSALETGYGASAPGNNYFGVKSHGRAGGQVLPTQEAGAGGGLYQTQDSFRTYADPGASARDYAEFLKTNSRYAPVLQAQGLDAQIEAMGRSGYATDPNYTAKLRQIVSSLPPVGMPNGPAGLVPNGPAMAQMPGPPQALFPAGNPPPVPMPQAGGPSRGVPGPIAQGDTPQADGSGTPVAPGGVRVTPESQLSPEVRSVREIVRQVRPGFRVMITPKTGLPIYDSQGRLYVQGPNGEPDYLEIQKVQQPPSGYRPRADGSLEPIPGGPADKPQGSGPFPGQSVEANALNMLIANGTLTPQQAAELAAGKTVVNPADGSIVFMTPSGIFGKPQGGEVQPLTPPPTAPASPPTAVKIPGAAPSPSAPTQSPAPTAQPGMIPITPPKPQNMTEGQANAALYADRMRKADAIIQNVGSAGLDAKGKLLEKIPFGAGNYLQDDKYQLYEQARRDFINAVLRRESGAVISDTEFENAEKQYFPRPGDSPVVLKQKAENRVTAIDGISRAAGNSYKPPGASGGDYPQQAVDRLKANPGERAMFDEIFGPGAAAKVLGR